MFGPRSLARLAATLRRWCPLPALLLAAASQAQGLLDFSADERARIAAHGPWPPSEPRDVSNRIQGQAAARDYGRRLFHDAGLSADGRQSCAGCHRPGRAFQDGAPVATGRERGLRNTPGLLDVADRRWFGWDGAHDSLWRASMVPLLDPREMAQRVEVLAAKVRHEPDRRRAYRRAFGASPPADDEALVVDLAKALAAYQATLRSPRTPFDEFRDALLRNDRRRAARYPLAAQRGLRLFIGRAHCAICHAGASFTNDEFADIGVPFLVPGGADAGRHAGLTRLLSSGFNRLGRYNDGPAAADPRAVLTEHLVIEPRHFGEFRVPGLRQLRHTAPYMHDGRMATLADVVRHYSELDEERLHADGERILRRLDLRPDEAADLVAFLRTLSR